MMEKLGIAMESCSIPLLLLCKLRFGETRVLEKSAASSSEGESYTVGRPPSNLLFVDAMMKTQSVEVRAVNPGA